MLSRQANAAVKAMYTRYHQVLTHLEAKVVRREKKIKEVELSHMHLEIDHKYLSARESALQKRVDEANIEYLELHAELGRFRCRDYQTLRHQIAQRDDQIDQLKAEAHLKQGYGDMARFERDAAEEKIAEQAKLIDELRTENSRLEQIRSVGVADTAAEEDQVDEEEHANAAATVPQVSRCSSSTLR